MLESFPARQLDSRSANLDNAGIRDQKAAAPHHKAIYVANSYRTLGCIGQQHAEPVLRSLAYALLMQRVAMIEPGSS